MNKLLLAGSALVTLATGTAMAADMQMKVKSPPVVAAYNWTGCYIGGTIGGDYGTSKYSATSTTGGWTSGQDLTPSMNVGGTVGGGKLGCNYQFGSIVIGVEADDTWTNNKGNSPDLLPGGGSATIATTTTQSWIATQRGRIGYAWDAVKDGSTGLVYFTGGVAETNLGTQVCNVGIACITTTNTQTGYTIGGGLDIPIYRSGWIFTFDYLYVNFGTDSSFNTPVVLGGLSAPSRSTMVQENILRVGLDYKFDWGAPVVARY